MRNHGIASDGLPSFGLKDDRAVMDAAARVAGLATCDNPYCYEVQHENLRGASSFVIFESYAGWSPIKFLLQKKLCYESRGQ